MWSEQAEMRANIWSSECFITAAACRNSYETAGTECMKRFFHKERITQCKRRLTGTLVKSPLIEWLVRLKCFDCCWFPLVSQCTTERTDWERERLLTGLVSSVCNCTTIPVFICPYKVCSQGGAAIKIMQLLVRWDHHVYDAFCLENMFVPKFKKTIYDLKCWRQASFSCYNTGLIIYGPGLASELFSSHFLNTENS